MTVYVTRKCKIPDDGDCDKCKHYVRGQGGFAESPDECKLFDNDSYGYSGDKEQFMGKQMQKCKDLKQGDIVHLNK